MTGDEIIRKAADLGGEQGAAFLSNYFAENPEDLRPTILATKSYYDDIEKTFRKGTPENVVAFLTHLRETLL